MKANVRESTETVKIKQKRRVSTQAHDKRGGSKEKEAQSAGATDTPGRSIPFARIREENNRKNTRVKCESREGYTAVEQCNHSRGLHRLGHALRTCARETRDGTAAWGAESARRSPEEVLRLRRDNL